jgi:hypothetical protein
MAFQNKKQCFSSDRDGIVIFALSFFKKLKEMAGLLNGTYRP